MGLKQGGNSGASSHSDLGKHPTQSHRMMMSPEKPLGVGIDCHDVRKQPPSDGITRHMAHRVRDERAKPSLLMFKKSLEAIKEVLGGPFTVTMESKHPNSSLCSPRSQK